MTSVFPCSLDAIVGWLDRLDWEWKYDGNSRGTCSRTTPVAADLGPLAHRGIADGDELHVPFQPHQHVGGGQYHHSDAGICNHRSGNGLDLFRAFAHVYGLHGPGGLVLRRLWWPARSGRDGNRVRSVLLAHGNCRDLGAFRVGTLFFLAGHPGPHGRFDGAHLSGGGSNRLPLDSISAAGPYQRSSDGGGPGGGGQHLPPFCRSRRLPRLGKGIPGYGGHYRRPGSALDVVWAE